MRSALSRSMLIALLSAPACLPAQEAAPAGAPPPSTPANAQRPAEIGRAPTGKALIVFFREPKIMGAVAAVTVRKGDHEVGTLRSGRYFVVTVDPGTHVYSVQGETRDVLEVDAEAGQTYYVEGSIGMGLLAGRPDLAMSSEVMFANASDTLEADR